MFTIRAILLTVISLVTGNSYAQYYTPDSGWYWNPGFSGSGYNIEFQDDTMFLSFFSYSASGSSTFYTLSGKFNTTTGRVAGDLFTFSGGQCIGCPYIAPQIINTGPAIVQFQNKSNAIITLPRPGGSVSIPVERFVFAYGPLQADQKLGAWVTSILFSSGAESDVIRMRRTQTNPDRTVIAVGDIHPTGRSVIGFGSTIPGTSTNYAYLVDFSNTNNALYLAEFTLNGFSGAYFVYPKGGQPSGSGVLVFGTRIAGLNTAIQEFHNSPDILKSSDNVRIDKAMRDPGIDHPQIDAIRSLATRLEQLMYETEKR